MPTRFVRGETNSHWYTRQGAPMHEVPRASGEGMRPTDVRDAKRLGLLPSVTNILGGLAKPGIDAWKRNQLVSAALALPRLEGEADADFASRLVEAAEAPSLRGSDFGTRLHQGIEDWLRSSGELWPEDETLAPFIDGFRDWFKEQGLQVRSIEAPFAAPAEGFAGTCDLLAQRDGGSGVSRPCAVDWKSQAGTTLKDLKHYEEWAPQVVAYARGQGLADAIVMTVVISNQVPGLISAKLYDAEQQERNWRAFLAARDLFYSPVGKGKELEFVGIGRGN